MARTIMIMAGGTGGHVFPALAVADSLRASGWNVIWLGTRAGMEATLVPARGYEVAWIRFSGLRGKGFLPKLLLPMNLLVAFWQSARAIFARRPDVVLGMGGYISFPGGMMASLLNRPLAIHEQNSVAGLANRVLARIADRVLVSFPETLAHGEFVGNPVRTEIARIAPPAERYAARTGPLRLLVVGGSLGAAALNDVVPKALARIPEAARPVVTHQSGNKHIAELHANYAAAGVAGELVPFIEDMAAAYAGADVVICRAGATTVAELAATGVASLLVPFPFAVDDHQTTNAQYLVDRGAAILERQAKLTPDRLAEILGGLTRDALRQMAECARAAARPDATEAVARACMELAK
jgi:UDP-N-acetylglucosamine--N-acetylmuramyl-(pentapeptide) pyrophosphoryl-undecaprenol N-acetylglucosamine transferase